ncbi:MAG: alpha/beta fold hydrolase [Gemmatimonadota bacterium]
MRKRGGLSAPGPTILLAGALAAPGSLAGLQTPSPRGQTAVPPAGPELVLEPCRISSTDPPARCGRYPVFENRVGRTGRILALRVVVLPALGPDRRPDPVFVLAGGPGQGAAELAPAIGEILPIGLRRHRDLVLVDQRGTGDSHPLRCQPESVEKILEALELRFDPSRLRACRERLDADPAFYTTPVAADDLDDIRRALGYERINLWGGSYGSRVALVYLRRHPAHVRAIVLRGVVPTYYELPLYFARDAEVALDHVISACAAEAACHRSFPYLRTELATVLHRLEQQPASIQTRDPGGGGTVPLTITRDMFAGGIRLLLYGAPTSRFLPAAMRSALGGDFGPWLRAVLPPVRALARQISLGTFLSVACTEDVSPIDDEDVRRETGGTFLGSAPVENLRRACAAWPRGALPHAFFAPVLSDVPALIISGADDPVTPPRWGKLVARRLPRSLHLVLPRTGHFPAAPGCTADLALRFLEAGTSDGLDASCVEAIARPLFFVPGR